jgi:hypothetical protein
VTSVCLPVLLDKMARIFEETNRFRLADQHFTRSVELDCYNGDSHLGRTGLLLAGGQAQEAIAVVDALLKVCEGKDEYIHNYKGTETCAPRGKIAYASGVRLAECFRLFLMNYVCTLAPAGEGADGHPAAEEGGEVCAQVQERFSHLTPELVFLEHQEWGRRMEASAGEQQLFGGTHPNTKEAERIIRVGVSWSGIFNDCGRVLFGSGTVSDRWW